MSFDRTAQNRDWWRQGGRSPWQKEEWEEPGSNVSEAHPLSHT